MQDRIVVPRRPLLAVGRKEQDPVELLREMQKVDCCSFSEWPVRPVDMSLVEELVELLQAEKKPMII